MRRFLSYTLLLVTAWLTGCAASGPKFADVSASFPPVKATEGRVVFYRDSSMVGAAIRPEIRLDGEVVGKSSPGSFFYVDTAPGQRLVSATTEKETTLALNVTAAKTHYVRSNITMGVMVGHVKFREEPEVAALSELPALAYIGAGARDLAVGSPAPRPATATATENTAALANTVRAGDEFEYQIIDQYTKTNRKVVYRVDRIEGERVIFNGGDRIEKLSGEVVSITNPIGGDMDRASPPGGWGKANLTPGRTWDVKFDRSHAGDFAITYKLRATVGATTMMSTPAGQQEVTLITYTGWLNQFRMGQVVQGKGSIKVWFAPKLQRVVRLNSDIDAVSGSSLFSLASNELTTLTAIRRR